MQKYPKEKFEWKYEFIFKVLARGIFPGNQYDIEETKNAFIEAINGDNPNAVIVPDDEHCGNKLIFPVKERLVSFPFVIERGKIVVKSVFYSEKKDIDAYAKKFKMRNKIIKGKRHD